MTFKLLIITALSALNRHKTRSMLTTLGIIVGVVAIITVMSIGQGAKYKVQENIKKLGQNFIIVFGRSPKQFANMKGGLGQNLTLKEKDLISIQKECDDIEKVSPILPKTKKVIYQNKNWQTMIGGVNKYIFDIRNLKLISGRYFNSNDINSKNRVAIIGTTILKELFEGEDPIGKKIIIKKLPFEVIGVMEEQGKSPDGRDQDDMIMIPVTTMQRKLLGLKNKNFAMLIMKAASKDRMKQASAEVRAILRQQHKLRETDEDDFTIFSQDDVAQASEAASRILNILLLVIASISLLVGGIGIMNIMLVTVTERTREIGLRMAIGSTAASIQNQFIIESILICLLGGILGILFGVTTSIIIGKVLGWPIFISIQSILVSLFSSTLIGLFFGFYPAYQASQLNPVEALFEK
ncbi:MAG: ABC transporter permease [bacterium]